MFFCKEDYEKIAAWLATHGAKDTDFCDVKLPYTGQELLALVQDGKNKKTTLKSFLDNALAVMARDFLNLSHKGDTYDTLADAISVVPDIDRKLGQVITWMDSDGQWYIYQFRGDSIDDWCKEDEWIDVMSGAPNHFRGYFLDEETLMNAFPNPQVGDYAFVNITNGQCGKAWFVYICTEPGVWKATQCKAFEFADKWDAIYGKDFGEIETIYGDTEYTYADRALADADGNVFSDTYVKLNVLANTVDAAILEYLTQQREAGSLIGEGTVTLDNLSDSLKDYIGSGGNVTNMPDEEDLTEVDHTLKFADKLYDKLNWSGYGRKFLRKNMSGGVNLLEQWMFEDENGNPLTHTIFIIQYDYCMNGATIEIPEDSILLFLGGSISSTTEDFGTLKFMGDNMILPFGNNFGDLFTNIYIANKDGKYSVNDNAEGFKEGQLRYNPEDQSFYYVYNQKKSTGITGNVTFTSGSDKVLGSQTQTTNVVGYQPVDLYTVEKANQTNPQNLSNVRFSAGWLNSKSESGFAQLIALFDNGNLFEGNVSAKISPKSNTTIKATSALNNALIPNTCMIARYYMWYVKPGTGSNECISFCLGYKDFPIYQVSKESTTLTFTWINTQNWDLSLNLEGTIDSSMGRKIPQWIAEGRITAGTYKPNAISIDILSGVASSDTVTEDTTFSLIDSYYDNNQLGLAEAANLSEFIFRNMDLGARYVREDGCSETKKIWKKLGSDSTTIYVPTDTDTDTEPDTTINITKETILDLLGISNDTTKFLRADGKWATPTDTKYGTVTTTTPGLMSPEDKLKLDSLSISNDDEGGDDEGGSSETIIIHEGGNQNVPKDSVLYTCNPYTYIKVILKGDIGGQLLAQRGGYKWVTKTYSSIVNTEQRTVKVTIPAYEDFVGISNSGDVYESLIESKPFHIVNGEDKAAYDLLEYKDGLPYLFLGKYDSEGSDLGLGSDEIILIDGENPQTVGNCTYLKQYKVTSAGSVVKPYIVHVLLPVLDGGAHTITYIGGTILLEAATTVSRSYMAMLPTTSYEDRLPSANGERESLEGYILATDADQTHDITFYVIHEQVDTYSGTLPKEIMFKGTYHMMNKMERDGVGPVDGIPIVGTYYIGGPRLQKYNPDSGLWIQYPWGNIENTTITMVNNEAQIITNSNSKTITLNPTSNIVSSATNNTRTYTDSIINTDGISKISYRVIYKVDIKAESIPSDAFDDHSVFNMSINNPMSGVTSQLVKATAIKDVVE